jgi:nicotinamide/nicotinate riboside kinase
VAKAQKNGFKAMTIGIGGVSRAGKSTLASLLLNHFRTEGKKCIVFHQDDFIRPEHLIPKIKDRTDWESPLSIDIKLLHESMLEAKPKFDIIIVEGLFAFYFGELTAEYDFKIFVEISREEFFVRKNRDKRWGEVPAWFMEHIWDSYVKYGIPDFSTNDIRRVSGLQKFDLKGILTDI